jgi:hypothetical protein
VGDGTVKTSLGKLTLPTPVGRFFAEQLAANRFDPLALTFDTSMWLRRCRSIIAIRPIGCWSLRRAWRVWLSYRLIPCSRRTA